MNTILLLLLIFAVLYIFLNKITPNMPDHKHREVTSVKSYTLNAPKSVEEIEQEKEMSQLRKKHEEFLSIMNYDTSTAYKRKSDFE